MYAIFNDQSFNDTLTNVIFSSNNWALVTPLILNYSQYMIIQFTVLYLQQEVSSSLERQSMTPSQTASLLIHVWSEHFHSLLEHLSRKEETKKCIEWPFIPTVKPELSKHLRAKIW